jgi:UDP-glucuronate 4-epimerase
MATERFLVTGALGCIGAWATKRLIEEGVPVWTYDLGGSKHRLELIMPAESMNKINFISGDITDYDAFERAVADNGITHIVHLAALQVPFVKADPVLGARVNVVGMANVLEAARRHADQLQGLSYASSYAVYGPPGAPRLQTSTLYGVHKQAKEGMARIYWQDYGLRSVGLRPHTVYGPGRDQGMTSVPTKAMLAAAVGRPYRIAYGGEGLYHYADDAAAVFIKAARTKYDGAPSFDIDGSLTTMDDVIQAIVAAAPDSAGKITSEAAALAVPSAVDLEPLKAILGSMTVTPFKEAVRNTVETFRTAAKAGKVDVDRILN